jgi:2'-5' RNA ligase
VVRPDAQLALFPELPQPKRRRASSRRARMFFALWPDAPLRAELAAAAALIPPGDSVRAHRVSPEHFHLTLAFLGELDGQQAEAAQQAGDCVRVPPFRLQLDEIGHFGEAKVAWIGPRTLPQPLVQLKAALDRELLRFGLPVESGPFRPHVSCVRGVRETPDVPPVYIDWWVSGFALVRSALKPGSAHYRIVRRWLLSDKSQFA